MVLFKCGFCGSQDGFESIPIRDHSVHCNRANGQLIVCKNPDCRSVVSIVIPSPDL